MFNENAEQLRIVAVFCHTIGRNKSIAPLLIKNKKTWKILISEKVMPRQQSLARKRCYKPPPVDKIPDGPTTPEIAYQMVKDETFAQTQPRLNLATFVTTYMDDYATKLMNEAININYIDETEYPRIAVMNAKCINIM